MHVENLSTSYSAITIRSMLVDAVSGPPVPEKPLSLTKTSTETFPSVHPSNPSKQVKYNVLSARLTSRSWPMNAKARLRTPVPWRKDKP